MDSTSGLILNCVSEEGGEIVVAVAVGSAQGSVVNREECSPLELNLLGE